jgi:hypothetical protein
MSIVIFLNPKTKEMHNPNQKNYMHNVKDNDTITKLQNQLNFLGSYFLA